MHVLDWSIVIAYLGWVVWTGARLSRRSGDSEAFFLAKRSLPWWAVGLSVIATQMSAITLIGTTGQAYAEGMRFIQFYFGLSLHGRRLISGLIYRYLSFFQCIFEIDEVISGL